MSSLPVTRISPIAMKLQLTLWTHLKPADVIVFPAEVDSVEELEFDDTKGTALFKDRKNNVQVCVRIFSNTLRRTVSVFGTVFRPNLVVTHSFQQYDVTDSD